MKHQYCYAKALTLAAPQSTEPNKKMTIPKIKTHFLPKMSENFENRGSMETLVSICHKKVSGSLTKGIKRQDISCSNPRYNGHLVEVRSNTR